MKKTIRLALLTLSSLALTLTSCSLGGETVPEEDPSKVNLVVGNLDTGFGTEWLYSIASRYEELHKDDVYGNKKGVKIKVIPTTDSSYPKDASMILSDSIDVHFRENVNIDRLIAGNALMDLTETLSSVNPYDNKTIESKISNDDMAVNSMNGKTYAAPFYSGSYGIVYNKNLFKDKKLYISKRSPKNPVTVSEVILTGRDADKSEGYDGEFGTYDDGLPCTYNELMQVVQTAAGLGDVIPFGWSSRFAEQYVTQFLISAFGSSVGYEEAKLRYSFDGTAKSLGTIDANEKFVKDNGRTVITNGKDGNGYEMFRSKGIYDALTLYKQMTSDKSYYISQESDFDHYTLQEYMVNGYPTKNDVKSVAMCVDGSWFMNELTKHMTESQLDGTSFGFMPIPKETFDGVIDRKYVFTETAQSSVFVKGNISDEYKKAVALDFVKFFYSDDELVNFAKSTKCVIGVNYPEISKTSQDYEDLTSFGQDVYEMTQNSYRINVNYPNQFYLNNKSELSGNNFFKASISITNPVKSLAGTKSVASYISDMSTYYTKEMWASLS